MAATEFLEPDLDFIRDLQRFGGDTLKKCYQCAACSVVCKLSPDERPFPRKEMIWAAWGLKDKLLADPDVWLCHQCNDCTTYCPRGARPGDVLAAVRDYAYRHFAFPQFMGKAMANPWALPLLLLIPIIAVAALVGISTDGDLGFLNDGQIVYSKLLKHGVLEGFFIAGNVLVFIVAAVGFVRFWKNLKAATGEQPGPGFVACVVQTLQEIFSHRSFSKCQANRPRYFAHMLVFYGFIGAMITAGLAILYAYVLVRGAHFIPWWHPFKIFGVASGLALLIGGGILIYRRLKGKDQVGANSYPDRLFLYVVFLVGLTGMLSWLVRLSGWAIGAYTVYYLHIVLVFFLLWYMPYSKFAHMFYRGLALVYCRHVNRSRQRQADTLVSGVAAPATAPVAT